MRKLFRSVSPVLLFLSMNSSIFAAHVQPDSNISDHQYMVLPFVLLLLMIATGPLFYKHFWERHYPKVAIILGSITVIFYLAVLGDSHSILHTVSEYLSFIALLASLFVASGGIYINVDKKATPMVNILLLLAGSVIANIVGTTGASMLLIRPYLKVNKDRVKPYHIVFFIFAVSNIGGALTPVGDPPLFLGFLRGVEFFWVIEHVWYVWAPTLFVLMCIFYILDRRNNSQHGHLENEHEYTGKITFKGWRNVGFLAIIIASVFLEPNVLSWVPSLSPLPFGIREIIMFAVVYFSYQKADKEILRKNEFDFEPIREVAYLFAGLFATMLPALQLIAQEAKVYGDDLTSGMFFWLTGSLSAFLDNAPTYLNFMSAAMGKFGLDVNEKVQVLQLQMQHAHYLQAISIGAVFFGALTYIGNAPNFMVKSISERSGIKMPGFFGYIMKYSVPILIPVFLLIWFVFFYGQG